MATIDFEKYYKLPLKFDGFNYAWDKNGNMALMFDFNVQKEDAEKIVNTINGTAKHKIKKLKFDGVDFFDKDNYIFCIRGWGNLTGIGANNLPESKAAEIQDAFRDFVHNQLI